MHGALRRGLSRPGDDVQNTVENSKAPVVDEGGPMCCMKLDVEKATCEGMMASTGRPAWGKAPPLRAS